MISRDWRLGSLEGLMRNWPGFMLSRSGYCITGGGRLAWNNEKIRKPKTLCFASRDMWHDTHHIVKELGV